MPSRTFPARKRRTFSYRVILAPPLIGLTLAVSACKGGSRAGAPNNRSPVARPVTVATVSIGEVIREFEGPAEVQPNARTQITSTFPERITKILVEVGDTVARGEALVLLDPTDAERQVSLAQANLQIAEAQLKKAEAGPRAREIQEVEALYEKAKNDYERGKQLLEEGALSREAYDALKAAYESTEARLAIVREGTRPEDLEAARAGVAAARAQLDLAVRRLEQMTIRAPFNGTVVSRSASPGDYAVPGMSLLVLDSAEPPKVGFYLSYDLVRSLKAGEKGSFTPAGEPTSYRVTVENISRSGGTSLQFQVRMAFTDSAHPPAGIAGKIVLPVARQTGIRVPRSAVIQRENQSWVFRLVDGKAKRTPVTVALEGTEYLLVSSGLAEGDRVITTDVEFLKDDDPVVIK
ncbi:MAG: efflux RND transporter periplasmic adaptor subunit [bacterium JZ-2024 1]